MVDLKLKKGDYIEFKTIFVGNQIAKVHSVNHPEYINIEFKNQLSFVSRNKVIRKVPKEEVVIWKL